MCPLLIRQFLTVYLSPFQKSYLLQFHIHVHLLVREKYWVKYLDHFPVSIKRADFVQYTFFFFRDYSDLLVYCDLL